MATFPTFDEYYRPKLVASLNQCVDNMEKKVQATKHMNDADEAEKGLDKACDQFTNKVKTEMNNIRRSIKEKRPISTSSNDELEKYRIFVQATTASIISTQKLFDKIISHIHNMIKIVVDWIRKGLSWMENIVKNTFDNIRSLFEN